MSQLDIDPYQVLGVTSSSSLEEIKSKYKSLAMIYHPDRQGGNADKFKVVKIAFQMILESIKTGKPLAKSRASDFNELKSGYGAYVKAGMGQLPTPGPGAGAIKVDMSGFNQKFVQALETDDSGFTISQALKDDYREKRTKDQLLSEYASVDSEISQIKPIFQASRFDNRVFQRAFEHVNAESSSKALQTYEEPQALISGLQPFTEIDNDFKLKTSEVGSLQEGFAGGRNPVKIDRKLIQQFSKQPDITDVSRLEADYHTRIKTKLNQLKSPVVVPPPAAAAVPAQTQPKPVRLPQPQLQPQPVMVVPIHGSGPSPGPDFFAKIPYDQPVQNIQQMQRQLEELKAKVAHQQQIIKNISHQRN